MNSELLRSPPSHTLFRRRFFGSFLLLDVFQFPSLCPCLTDPKMTSSNAWATFPFYFDCFTSILLRINLLWFETLCECSLSFLFYRSDFFPLDSTTDSAEPPDNLKHSSDCELRLDVPRTYSLFKPPLLGMFHFLL